MSQLGQPARRTVPVRCETTACKGKVHEIYGAVCPRCSRRLVEAFWKAMGWDMRGRWEDGVFISGR